MVEVEIARSGIVLLVELPIIERNAHGVEEPMPTCPFAFTRNSDVVAEPLLLVEDAMSKSVFCEPKASWRVSFANGEDVPIPTLPLASTVKSEVVAEPEALVEDAISKRFMRDPKVPCSAKREAALDVPIISEPSEVILFDEKKLVLVALVAVAKVAERLLKLD